MSQTQIDTVALEGMASLLGDQFDDTVQFCFSEFDRLYQEVVASLERDKAEAIRNAHSLKSNAAQFGALSLAELAKHTERTLTQHSVEEANQYIAKLPDEIAATKTQMTAWLENR